MGSRELIKQRRRLRVLFVYQVSLTQQSPCAFVIAHRYQPLANSNDLLRHRWILAHLREVNIRKQSERVGILRVDCQALIKCGDCLIATAKFILRVAQVVIVRCVGFHFRGCGCQHRNRFAESIGKDVGPRRGRRAR